MKKVKSLLSSKEAIDKVQQNLERKTDQSLMKNKLFPCHFIVDKA